MTPLAIIIVSYNSRAELDGCLRSLADRAPRSRHEIVVVDNGSTRRDAGARPRTLAVRQAD